MSDIVERLKSPATVFYEYAADDGALLREAAAEINRLRKLLSETNTYYAECIAMRGDLRDALHDTLASLVVAVSLLERGGKKAAPSDKMFAQMIIDYKSSIERGRAAAAALKETGDE